MTNVPEIEVRLMPAKYFRLFINGRERDTWSGRKVAIRKILKREYGIDLRTDPRIIKNYIEKTTRKISEVAGVETIIRHNL